MEKIKTKKSGQEGFLYILTFLAVCYPVTCGYLMNTGSIAEWTARVRELAGSFTYLLFPSDGLILEQNAQLGAMNSNLWYLLPALVVKVSDSLFAAWCVFQLLLQAATMGAVYLMSSELLEKRGEAGGSLFAVLLYMTCPYRLYVCYEAADLSEALVWMLLPLYLWGAARFLDENPSSGVRGKWISGGVAAAALTGIAYADVMQFLILAGVTVLAVLFRKKWTALLVLPVSCVLSAPVLLRLLGYLFRGACASLNLPLSLAADSGYLPGEMLHMFLFHEGHPGLGLGLVMSLLCGIWLVFVRAEWRRSSVCRFFVWMSVFLLVLSLRAFPWEVVQRIGTWALRLIPLLGTPAVFFGMAQTGLCVAGAIGVSRMRGREDVIESKGIPLAVILACLVGCIYQCNQLVYNCMPL